MKAAGFGRIINVASAHALVASPFKSAYVAAKHGVLGLTKTVALEGAQSGVTCNAICPGYVWTPLVENQIADTARARGIDREAVIRDVLLAAQPTKRFATVEGAGRAGGVPLRPRRRFDHRRCAAGRRRLDRAMTARRPRDRARRPARQETIMKTLHDELKSYGQIVLVLQGGGALGAYQVGVYQALAEAGIAPDWLVGTSIGAINAALIAGGPPERRASIGCGPSGAASRATASWAPHCRAGSRRPRAT